MACGMLHHLMHCQEDGSVEKVPAGGLTAAAQATDSTTNLRLLLVCVSGKTAVVERAAVGTQAWAPVNALAAKAEPEVHAAPVLQCIELAGASLHGQQQPEQGLKAAPQPQRPWPGKLQPLQPEG